MSTLASPTIQLDIRPTIFQVLITIKKNYRATIIYNKSEAFTSN